MIEGESVPQGNVITTVMFPSFAGDGVLRQRVIRSRFTTNARVLLHLQMFHLMLKYSFRSFSGDNRKEEVRVRYCSIGRENCSP